MCDAFFMFSILPVSPRSARGPAKPMAAALAAVALALLPLPSPAARVECGALAQAAPPSAEALRTAMLEAHDHGYLWRIRKDGRSSYLYGTMHVGRLDWMFPGPRTRQALDETDAVALEFDPMDQGLQERLAQAVAQMPHVAISAALQERIRREAEALCVPYASLARLPPEFQIVNLTAMAGRKDDLDAQYGIDIGLALVARQAGKPVVSLETPESQVQTLQLRDPAEAAAFIEKELDDLEPGRSEALLQRMVRAWVRSDYDEMAHYADWCQCLDTPVERELMMRLLDGRNPALAHAIDELHRSGRRVFAATGSLHLFGPSGLPALLAQRGYRVERIDYGAYQ